MRLWHTGPSLLVKGSLWQTWPWPPPLCRPSGAEIYWVGSFSEILNLLLNTWSEISPRYVLDEEWRSRNRHLVRWWNTVLHQVNTIMFVAFSTKKRCVRCSTWHVMIVCCVSLTTYFIVEIWSTEWLVGWTWLGFARSSSNKQGWEQWWRTNSLLS